MEGHSRSHFHAGITSINWKSLLEKLVICLVSLNKFHYFCLLLLNKLFLWGNWCQLQPPFYKRWKVLKGWTSSRKSFISMRASSLVTAVLKQRNSCRYSLWCCFRRSIQTEPKGTHLSVFDRQIYTKFSGYNRQIYIEISGLDSWNHF